MKEGARPVIFGDEKSTGQPDLLESKKHKKLSTPRFVWLKKLRPVFFLVEKTLCPVIFHPEKSPRPFPGTGKVSTPKKYMPLDFYDQRKCPVIFGDQKSSRPAVFMPAPVSNKLWSLPKQQNW